MENQNTSSQVQNPSDQIRYWDLTTTGFGNLYDIRVVQPQSKKAQPMLCVRIKALCGPSDNVESRWFDCNVVGAKAKELVSKCIEASQAKCKIFAKFTIGDADPQSYAVKKAKNDIETRHINKGRLLRISYLTIDKKLVYREEKENTQSANSASNTQTNDPRVAQINQSTSETIPDAPADQGQFDQASTDCQTASQPDPQTRQLLETVEQF